MVPILLFQKIGIIAKLHQDFEKKNPYEVSKQGSKFFVGGSDDDFLSGGSADDYLIGDRLNGYELFLNRDALSRNIPNSVTENRLRLRNYQPSDWNEENPRPKYMYDDKGIGNFKETAGGYYVLRPGSDVIHGQGGDDTIYGDSTDENHDDIYKYKQALIVTKDGKEINVNDTLWGRDVTFGYNNWYDLRIGADFIDGGSGNDEIHGGLGSDAIIGSYGSDLIYIGDQIIAPGYQPLWGPKIIWGDTQVGYSETPDLFVVGNLLTSEDQLKSSSAIAAEDRSFSYQNISNKWTDFVNTVVTSVISELVFDVSTLFGALIDLLSKDKGTNAYLNQKSGTLDGLTVIRDFGSKDLLVYKVRSGEAMSVTRDPFDAFIDGQADHRYDYNPLVGNGAVGNGVTWYFKPTAGESYAHLFLENYTSPLYKLGEKVEDGVKYVLLGGDFYANGHSKYI
jgi:hypothetical protein